MSLPTPEALRSAASIHKKQGQALEALAVALDPASPSRLAAALAGWEKAGSVAVEPLLAPVVEWLREEKGGRRERLGAELRAACASTGVEMLVLTRDPLELRLPPLGVRVDLEAGEAEITFAREVLATTDTTAEGILRGRATALAALEEGPWEPAAFHTLLHRSWVRATGGSGEWAELADVLPELAFLKQGKAFRQDPSPRRFEPYSKAQFAYDLWRLRRDRGLTLAGLRLSVAPATGASTRDKSRVYWLEDDRGAGQFHLTLRFTREEAARE